MGSPGNITAQAGRGQRAQQAAAEMAAAVNDEKNGRIPSAIARYRNALELLPGDANALLHLGRLLLQSNRADEAVPHLEAALRAAKRPSAGLHHILGAALLACGRFAEAETHLTRALAAEPRSAAILKSLGTCALRAGRPADAEQRYRKAVALAPADAEAKLMLAALLLYEGNRKEAASLYRELLAAGFQAPVVYAGLAEAADFKAEPPEYSAIVAKAGAPGISPVERRMLHFAAARIDRTLGRRDAEFGHYAAGKALLGDSFDLGYFAELVSALVETITPTFIAERQGFAIPDDSIVFILGMPRSGSSLTERIIAAHPKASAAGETTFLMRGVARLGIPDGHAGPRVPITAAVERIRSLSPAELTGLVEGHLRHVRAFGPSALRITDKTPHHFLHLWLIALALPRAAFVHTVRDPVATCFSCFTTDLNGWHTYTRDLATLGRYHRLYEKLMRHWAQVLPISIFESRYEELVAAPEASSRALVAAAGLEWDPACLNVQEAGRITQTASYAEVRKKIHSERVEAWRAYEAHLGPLLLALAGD